MDVKSGEFASLMTQLIRERNEVSDTLDEAIEGVEKGLQEIAQ
jgi:hypothetical protein